MPLNQWPSANMVVHNCKSYTQETEARGLLQVGGNLSYRAGLRAACLWEEFQTSQIQSESLALSQIDKYIDS